jgi:hypothetical protein
MPYKSMIVKMIIPVYKIINLRDGTNLTEFARKIVQNIWDRSATFQQVELR